MPRLERIRRALPSNQSAPLSPSQSNLRSPVRDQQSQAAGPHRRLTPRPQWVPARPDEPAPAPGRCPGRHTMNPLGHGMLDPNTSAFRNRLRSEAYPDPFGAGIGRVAYRADDIGLSDQLSSGNAIHGRIPDWGRMKSLKMIEFVFAGAVLVAGIIAYCRPQGAKGERRARIVSGLHYDGEHRKRRGA